MAYTRKTSLYFYFKEIYTYIYTVKLGYDIMKGT